jgi:hypothetical protein
MGEGMVNEGPVVATLGVDGHVDVWRMDANAGSHLREIRAVVGGYIEGIRLGADVYMYVDEEGKLKGLPMNSRATALAIGAGLPDFVVGPVLLVGFDGSPEIASLPPEFVERLAVDGL